MMSHHFSDLVDVRKNSTCDSRSLASKEVENLKLMQQHLMIYDTSYYKEVGRPYTRAERKRTLSTDAPSSGRPFSTVEAASPVKRATRQRSLSSANEEFFDVIEDGAEDDPVRRILGPRNQDIIKAIAKIRASIGALPEPVEEPEVCDKFRFVRFPEAIRFKREKVDVTTLSLSRRSGFVYLGVGASKAGEPIEESYEIIVITGVIHVVICNEVERKVTTLSYIKIKKRQKFVVENRSQDEAIFFLHRNKSVQRQ